MKIMWHQDMNSGLFHSKNSPTGPTEPTLKKLEDLIALATYLHGANLKGRLWRGSMLFVFVFGKLWLNMAIYEPCTMAKRVCFICLLCVCLVPVFLFLMAGFLVKDTWHVGVLKHYLTTSGPAQQMKTWKLRTPRLWPWFLVTSPKQWKFLLKRWQVWEGGDLPFLR